MHAMPLSDFVEAQARAAKWLAAWDGQGIHRTATAGDLAGAEWLAQEAAALGAEVTIEEFALDRLDPIECFLELGGRKIAAVPVFDAPATDGEGVIGRLADMVTMTVFITDARLGDRFTQLRREIFGDNYPASALITVAGLARPEMLVEVQGIAVVA